MNRNILLALLGVAIGVAVFTGDKESEPVPNPNPNDPKPTPKPSSPFPILRSNQYNPIVEKIQLGILQDFFSPLAQIAIRSTGGADGVFGEGTGKALAQYKRNPNMITKEDYEFFKQKLNLS